MFHALLKTEKEDVLMNIFKLALQTYKMIDIMVLWKEEKSIEVWVIDSENVGQKCGDLVPRKINKFQNNTFKSSITLVPAPKTFNYHKCKVKVALWDFKSNKNFLIELYEILARKFNFTLEMTLLNLTIMSENPELPFDLLRNRSIHSTYQFCNTRQVQGVSASEPMIVLKLLTAFKPRSRKNFSLYVLFSLAETSLSAYILCHVVFGLIFWKVFARLRNDIALLILEVQNMVHGCPLSFRTRKSPLLIAALMLALILRAYNHGIVFRAVTLDILDQNPSSLVDLQKGDFKVVMPNFGYDSQELYKSLSENFQVEPSKLSGDHLLLNLHKNPYKTGIFIDEYKLFFYLKNRLVDKRVHIILNPVMNLQRCLYYQENHPLNHFFRPYLQIVTEAGLVQKWITTLNLRKRNIYLKKEPTQICLGDLALMFVIVGYGFIVSFFVFLVELMYRKLKCKILKNKKCC